MTRSLPQIDSRIASAEVAIRGRIAWTRRGMIAEQIVRAFWPLWSLALIVGAVLAFGLPGNIEKKILVGLAGVAVLAALGLFAWGVRRLQWPTRGEAVARIDAVLPGRPLSALHDKQAAGIFDPAARGVWARHLVRMASDSRAARVSHPDLRLARHDPYGIRLIALIAAISAAVFARGGGEALNAALTPTPGLLVATGPSFEGWIRPPDYTGRPTLYLSEIPAGPVVVIPAGSVVTLRAYGDDGDFGLAEALSVTGNTVLSAAATGIQIAEFTASRSGEVSISQGGEPLGRWSFTVTPDAVPVIELVKPVERAASGATSLTYRATDDHGIVRGWVSLTLDLDDIARRYGFEPDPVSRPDIELDLPMPFSGGTAEIEENLIEDLSKHPWAGLPVRLTLQAEDAAGQTGAARNLHAILPGRRFFDPLAAAIVEQRRDLLWSPQNAARIDQVLRAISHVPEQIFDDNSAYLLTRTAIRRLGYAREDGLDAAEVDDIAEMLWQVALLIEDGSLYDAAERLRRAQDRLSEALENGATSDEMSQLLEELREAMQDYMQQLAEQGLEEGNTEQAQNQQGQQISEQMLQEMLDRIQELSEQGRTEEAQALLEQLRQMMENMRMMAQEGQQGGDQQGQQMMQDLQDTLRQQQDLADESFRQLQEQFNQNRQGQQPGQQGNQQGDQQGQQPGGGQQPGQGEPGGAEGQLFGQRPGDSGMQGSGSVPGGLAERQEALRQFLQELQGRLPGSLGQDGQTARDALREAERQMGEARDGLQQEDFAGALDDQARALDNLRNGMRGLGEEMQQAQRSEGQGGEQAGDGFGRNNRDPLGRPRGDNGSIQTDETLLPGGQDPFARARELFEEIRRRSSEQGRPVEELEYLKRLLERF